MNLILYRCLLVIEQSIIIKVFRESWLSGGPLYFSHFQPVQVMYFLHKKKQCDTGYWKHSH